MLFAGYAGPLIDWRAALEAGLDRPCGKGNCYDNAMVETMFETLKAEPAWRTSFKTHITAETAIGRHINAFNNPTKRHSALGIKSPIQFDSLPLKLAA